MAVLVLDGIVEKGTRHDVSATIMIAANDSDAWVQYTEWSLGTKTAFGSNITLLGYNAVDTITYTDVKGFITQKTQSGLPGVWSVHVRVKATKTELRTQKYKIPLIDQYIDEELPGADVKVPEIPILVYPPKISTVDATTILVVGPN